MTLTEAAAAIGREVVYQTAYGRYTGCEPPEAGVIESVGTSYAYVRFSAVRVAACYPENLTLAGGEA